MDSITHKERASTKVLDLIVVDGVSMVKRPAVNRNTREDTIDVLWRDPFELNQGRLYLWQKKRWGRRVHHQMRWSASQTGYLAMAIGHDLLKVQGP